MFELDLLFVFFFVLFRKALESLAGRESGDPHHLRERAQKEMEALRDAFNKRIAELEQVSQKQCLVLFSLV